MKKQTQKSPIWFSRFNTTQMSAGLASVLLVASLATNTHAVTTGTQPAPQITSWKATIMSERFGGSLQIYGTNLQPIGKTSMAPEAGSYIEIRYTNLTTKRFGETGFFGNQTNLSVYTSFSADLKNIREVAYVTKRGTATLGNKAPVAPSNTPKLASYKVVPMSPSVGGSIQLFGQNLNVRPAGTTTLRPEAGSSITLTYSNRYTKIVDEYSFFGDEKNLSFYTSNYTDLIGIVSVTYTSQRGVTTTATNLTVNQPVVALPQPSLSGFRISPQHTTSRLTLVGKNLVITTNAQKANEFVRVYFEGGQIKIYQASRYVGSPSNIYIFESGKDAFNKVQRVDFVSPSRTTAFSTTRL